MKRAKSPIPALCLTAFTAVAAALVVPQCGSSNSNSAPAPTTTPAPTATPTPTPTPSPETTADTMTVELVLVYESQNPHGFTSGETIAIDVRWTGFLAIDGSPRLRLVIGSNIRWAQFNQIYTSRVKGDRSVIRFTYEIRDDDFDEDGLSIPADAIDLNGGSITAATGSTEVRLELGDQAIDNLAFAKVNIPEANVATVTAVYFSGYPDNPPLGYLDGESIVIDVRFSKNIDISGHPKLRVEIGDRAGYAIVDYVHHADGYGDVRFQYRVLYDDHDADGISIEEDAIELNEGRIYSYDDGQDVNPTLGRHAIENLRAHSVRRTTPMPDIRDCSIERREVRRHPAGWIVDEWDGTPFRVDMVRNFPSFVSDEDLEELLDPIATMADDIEEHLGYRILEKGDLIPVPEGAPAGWNTDYHRYSQDPSMLPRKRGQLLAFYMDDDSSFWDHRGGAPMVAFPAAGTTSYNQRTMGKWWNDQDTCCVHRYNGNGRRGHTLVHEVAHLLGFEHPDVPFGTPGVRMAWGSTIAPWLSGSKVHYFPPKDIEVLKCIFPRR